MSEKKGKLRLFGNDKKKKYIWLSTFSFWKKEEYPFPKKKNVIREKKKRELFF